MRQGSFRVLGRSPPTAFAAACQLPDGSVLVSGGRTSTTVESTCYSVDPANGAVRVLDGMSEARLDHKVLLTNPTTVIAFGGSCTDILDASGGVVHVDGSLATEVFDIRVGKWRPGTLAIPNISHPLIARLPAAIIVAESRWSAAKSRSVTSVWCIDPGQMRATRSWTLDDTHCTGLVATSSGVLLFRGEAGRHSLLLVDETDWVPCGVELEWKPSAELLTYGEGVFAFGGDPLNPSAQLLRWTMTHGWERYMQLGAARGGALTATLFAAGQILVVGGADETDAEIIDLQRRTTGFVGRPSQPRWAHSAVSVADGVLIVGGRDADNIELFADRLLES